MITYHATVTRDGQFWVVRFPGIGTTQGIGREDAEHMARDFIATKYGIPYDDVRVTIAWCELLEPVARPWDAMVNAALEIIRRDSGYPSVADMDRDMPVWREQCEEIATAMLTTLLGSVESPGEDTGTRCPRCNPDNTCTLWCLDAMIAENTPGMVQEVFGLRRQVDRLLADIEAINRGELLDRYLLAVDDLNALQGRRCRRHSCDHLDTDHSAFGCARCACTELTRRATP